MLLLFKRWLIESCLQEMAVFNFGMPGVKGEKETAINVGYLRWLLEKIVSE